MKKFMLLVTVFLLATFSYATDKNEFVKKCKISAAGKLAEMKGFPDYCTYQYITRASIDGTDSIDNINAVFTDVYNRVLKNDTKEQFENRLATYLNFDKGVVKDEWKLPAYCEVILYKMEEKRNPNLGDLDPEMLSEEHNKKCQELLQRDF